jgi:hypothetical protein
MIWVIMTSDDQPPLLQPAQTINLSQQQGWCPQQSGMERLMLQMLAVVPCLHQPGAHSTDMK